MKFIKLLKLKKWENYLAFVKDIRNYSGIADICECSQDALVETDAENLFNELPQFGLLRTKYLIDGIDSAGNTLEKTIAIMNYLTRHTFYSGAQSHLVSDDAAGILEWSFDKGFGHAINCRFKAIAFTDLLMANGIKAYPILMRDKNLIGAHFTVHVYLPENGKWAVFDPSFNSYFTDKNGGILNVYELRSEMLKDIYAVEIVGYDFNGTRECKDVYRKYFISSLLANVSTWRDNSENLRYARNFAKRKPFDAKIRLQ